LLDGYNVNIKDIIKIGTGWYQYLSYTAICIKSSGELLKIEEATKRVTLLPYKHPARW
jgi:hypothetical protein